MQADLITFDGISDIPWPLAELRFIISLSTILSLVRTNLKDPDFNLILFSLFNLENVLSI